MGYRQTRFEYIASLFRRKREDAPKPVRATRTKATKRKYSWLDMDSLRSGNVLAFTTGEARAMVKRLVGVSKNRTLPNRVDVWRVA